MDRQYVIRRLTGESYTAARVAPTTAIVVRTPIVASGRAGKGPGVKKCAGS